MDFILRIRENQRLIYILGQRACLVKKRIQLALILFCLVWYRNPWMTAKLKKIIETKQNEILDTRYDIKGLNIRERKMSNAIFRHFFKRNYFSVCTMISSKHTRFEKYFLRVRIFAIRTYTYMCVCVYIYIYGIFTYWYRRIKYGMWKCMGWK